MLTGVKEAYFMVLVFSSILAWSSFFSVVFFTNPQSAGALGVAVLCVSAIFGLTSLAVILWQTVKLRKK